ncbi:hypothetical protein Tco_0740437 [Tanacetum coccineum]
MSHPADEFSQHLSDDDVSNHEDASDNGDATNKPKQQQLISTATTISNIKLLILKKEKYGIWAMKMEHYLKYINNDVWKYSLPEIHVLKWSKKVEHHTSWQFQGTLRRFHGMDDDKEIWEAIRTWFGGNANSKKMQKAVLKQQFEAFSISSSEGLEKGYDRFQQLLSQLEAHGAEVSNEDANHKFLSALPSAWSNTNKVKSGLTSTFSTCNPSTSSSNIPEREAPAGFADEVIYLLFAKQLEDSDLLHEDLE